MTAKLSTKRPRPLKRCPWCAERPRHYCVTPGNKWRSAIWTTICPGKDCGVVPFVVAPTAEISAHRWNTRTTKPR